MIGHLICIDQLIHIDPIGAIDPIDLIDLSSPDRPILVFLVYRKRFMFAGKGCQRYAYTHDVIPYVVAYLSQLDGDLS